MFEFAIDVDFIVPVGVRVHDPDRSTAKWAVEHDAMRNAAQRDQASVGKRDRRRHARQAFADPIKVRRQELASLLEIAFHRQRYDYCSLGAAYTQCHAACSWMTPYLDRLIQPGYAKVLRSDRVWSTGFAHVRLVPK
jgi:hypothetical protein